MEIERNISYVSSHRSCPLIGLTAHQLLEKRVFDHPDREMYVFVEDKERITFKDFKDRVENIACGLLSLGMEKGDRLAIWTDLHMEFPLCVAAARSIGLISVRIRANFPNSTVQDILHRTDSKVIVLGRNPRNLSNRLEDIKGSSDKSIRLPNTIIGVGDDNKGTYLLDEIEKIGFEPKFREMFSQRKNEVNPDDDCDIFSTSGSTGPPKLVVHTHSSGINGCNTFLSYIEEDKPHRRYLGRNSTHVSGEISLVMPPLVVGITAVLASPTYTIQSTLETIQNERCTDTLFLIKGLYDFVNFKEVDKYDLKSLTVCSTGGSSIPVDMMENFERKANCQVIMLYGSTEGMLLTSSTQWDSPTIRHSPGKPFPNVEIKVVNDDGICVPLGNVGEIWCRSPGMFKEYLGDEKRTKDTLTPRAWFKTGDLGVFDEYGILAIVGRQTEIINKGGAKVFPAPMENILSQHPSINQVQVIGVSDKRLGMEICICIRPQNDITIDGEHIFAYLNGKVRDVNLPGYVLIFDHFTTTDVGKIDRKALTKQVEYRIKNEYILKVKGNLN